MVTPALRARWPWCSAENYLLQLHDAEENNVPNGTTFLERWLAGADVGSMSRLEVLLRIEWIRSWVRQLCELSSQSLDSDIWFREGHSGHQQSPWKTIEKIHVEITVCDCPSCFDAGRWRTASLSDLSTRCKSGMKLKQAWLVASWCSLELNLACASYFDERQCKRQAMVLKSVSCQGR